MAIFCSDSSRKTFFPDNEITMRKTQYALVHATHSRQTRRFSRHLYIKSKTFGREIRDFRSREFFSLILTFPINVQPAAKYNIFFDRNILTSPAVSGISMSTQGLISF
jgi:hypothetical protein